MWWVELSSVVRYFLVGTARLKIGLLLLVLSSIVDPQLWNGRLLVKNVVTVFVLVLRNLLVILASCVVTTCSSCLIPLVLLLITVWAWLGLASVMCATLS